ncbi:MAG: DUF4105 domain-containing protein [bacterium]|nr:DUF4105 domain-containing protein [bacterium]
MKSSHLKFVVAIILCCTLNTLAQAAVIPDSDLGSSISTNKLSTKPWTSDQVRGDNSTQNNHHSGLTPIHAHPTWRKLLHIRPGHAKSDIISAEFFLAENGNADPKAELDATIAAFLNETDTIASTSPQCQFPARYMWLRQHVPELSSVPNRLSKCADYQKWTQQNTINGVSVMFATGYLDNPASYYGHTLIKFHTPLEKGGATLTDYALNYGAAVPENENPVVYILRGLFGGYTATYTHQAFFQYNHNYREHELRDMWAYRLNLPKDKIEFLAAHAWELLGKRYVYYFAWDNCAYRMADILALVTEAPMYQPRLPWAIPIGMFYDLMDHSESGSPNQPPIVSKITYLPSRQNRFYAKYRQLSTKEQSAVRELATHIATHSTHRHPQLTPSASSPTRLGILESPAYTSLSPTEQIRVIETLFDYIEYLKRLKKNKEAYKNEKRALVIERFRLPPNATTWEDTPETPPHKSQRPTKIGGGIISDKNGNTQGGLNFRIANFDTLTPTVDQLDDNTLEMAGIQIATTEKGLAITQFDAVNIVALNTTHANLPGLTKNAWKFNIGATRETLRHTHANVWHIGFGYGKTLALGNSTTLYGLIDSLAQTTTPEGSIAVSPTVGLLIHLGPSIESHLSHANWRYLNGRQSIIPHTKWETRFLSNTHYDIRFVYQHQLEIETRLGINYYF